MEREVRGDPVLVEGQPAGRAQRPRLFPDRAEGVVDEASNINGAAHSIAGIVNERGNVLGMMPHPENHVEDIMGCTDGRGLFAGLAAHLERAA